MARRMGYALSALAVAVVAVAWAGAQAESHVRIIRLSYVDGSVQMDKANSRVLEKAILNTPVIEGTRILTGHDGLAEIEFENNTTVRLGENSEVHFSRLVVNDAGAKVNEFEVVKGTVYIETRSGKDDIYRVSLGTAAFQVRRDSEMRLSDENGQLSVAVMKGEAQLENQPQEVKIRKKETLTLTPNSPAGYEIAKGVEAAPLDRWNNERSSYQTAYTYNGYTTGYKPMGSSFGYADLGYYGGWANVPGIGMAWQPYGASNWMGWNPYMAGAWSYLPGMGYSWASAYPWGWLPYHYGSWFYGGNGIGWYWTPGQTTSGWYTNGFQTAPVVHGPAGYTAPTPPTTLAGSSYRPVVKVGLIGNLPATIPGGRAVPNFRSVVPRSNYPVANSNAARTPQRGSVFAQPSMFTNGPVAGPGDRSVSAVHNNHANSGHVFVAPPPAFATYGGGFDATTSSMAMPSSAGGSAGMTPRAVGPSASHASAAAHANPK